MNSFGKTFCRKLTHISDNELTSLKTKLRSTCKKYIEINVPYKNKNVISNLSINKNIVVLKQDKGRGVAILDTAKYTGIITYRTFPSYNRSYCSHRQKDTKGFEKIKN